MDKKYYPLTGVEGISIAKEVDDSISGYSAGAPSALLPVQDVKWATEQPAEDLYANNKRQDTFYGTKKESIVFQTPNLSAEDDAEFRGIYLKPTSGRAYGTGNEEPPFVAMGFAMNKGKDDKVYMWFPKGKITGGQIVATTKNSGITLTTREYTFEAYVTDKQWTLDGKQTGISWVKGDTTTLAFSATGWFAQVQTPDTETPPSVLELSSTDPDDDETDVAITKEPKITFNNPILSEAIQIVNVDDGSVVAVTKSWNAARTQLTLSHAVDFTNGDVYRLNIFGVEDVYGQSLAASTRDFTIIAL